MTLSLDFRISLPFHDFLLLNGNEEECQFTVRSKAEGQDRVLSLKGLIYLLFEGTALNKC